MSPSTRPYHHGSLRDSLVDAGLHLARAGGPEAVVLRAASRQAGVSHNAAYRHFASHEDLIAAVGLRCMDELAVLMERRASEITTRNRVARAWARLDAIGRAYIEFARTETGWFRTAFSSAEPHEKPADPAAAGSGLGPYELLGARLDDLVEVGAIDPARRPGAEFAAWSTVHGLSELLVDGPLRVLPEAEVQRAISVALQVVRLGLAA